MEEKTQAPLTGIRVVEFTVAWAGPSCGFVLGAMGAEVIKIENAGLPDLWRRSAPYAEGVKGINRSGTFASFSRGKKDCVLDLKKQENVAVIKKLIGISDIVITNFSPRVMSSLGLGYQALKEVKPDIIMISLSGYGASGPDKDCIAYGSCLDPYAGLSSLLTYSDGLPHRSSYISDHLSGTLAAYAALAALSYRDISGTGQSIDVSEVEALLSCLPGPVLEYTMNGALPQRYDNKDGIMSPHGCYRCQGEDNWVAIAVCSDSEWRAMCLVMGMPELINDNRFQDNACRLKNQLELDNIVTEWTVAQDAHGVLKRLQEAKITCGPVSNGEEVFKNPHLQARGFFVETYQKETGKRELPGVIAKFSKTPTAVKLPDPLYGEHTNWLLNDLLGTDETK